MYNDPISNLLTVIRNSLKTQNNGKVHWIKVNSSKPLVKIAEILQENNYIEKFKVTNTATKKPILEVGISNSGNPNILGLKRISSPGLRVYAKAGALPTVLSGYGIAIISTSKGIMTNKEAKKLGLGGEVLAYVW